MPGVLPISAAGPGVGPETDEEQEAQENRPTLKDQDEIDFDLPPEDGFFFAGLTEISPAPLHTTQVLPLRSLPRPPQDGQRVTFSTGIFLLRVNESLNFT